MIKSKPVLLEHSIAKIELYRKYLAIYLNILARARYINKIYLFDLFSGEGKDEFGEKGSPLVAVETIKHHYFSNNNTCPNIDIIFNDSEMSEIDKSIKRIDRVKLFVDEISHKPKNLLIQYEGKKFNDIQIDIIKISQKLKADERALAFIDPFGYREIEPLFLKQFLQNEKTEILLFLPIYLMYRFVNKSVKEEDFPGGRALRKLLNELMDGKLENLVFKSEFHFIDVLKAKLKEYCKCKYSDTFILERSKSHHFCLFFLGNNKKGLLKILEAKWDLNKDNGRGFQISNKDQATLFGNELIEVSNYPKLLLDYLLTGVKTNMELFDFGLEQGYLPKHTRDCLEHLGKEHTIEVVATDGNKVKKGAYYIDDKPKKTIQIRVVKK